MQPQSQPKPRKQAFALGLMLCVFILLPLVLVVAWSVPPGNSPLWDWGNTLGYLGLAVCLFLFVYRGRPRTFPAYNGRFFANLHRDLGYIAMLLFAGHAGVLLYLEPLLVEHLKPSAPLHMLAGLLALLLMLVLVCFSLPTVRRRVWPNYHLFKYLHGVVSVAITAMVVFHIWVSGFYLNRPWKSGLAVAVVLLIGVYYCSGQNRIVRSGITRQRVSSGYSHWISYGAVLLSIVVCIAFAIAVNLE